MNKFIISLLIIEYIICAFDGTKLDELNTEPYHDFDWLDEDKYSISIGFTDDTANVTCCLFNGTVACKSSCKASGKTLSCEFVGNDCKADGDNPATKFYHSVLCGVCDSNTTAAAGLRVPANDVYVTVAVSRESYVKYSILLLLSLLVL